MLLGTERYFFTVPKIFYSWDTVTISTPFYSSPFLWWLLIEVSLLLPLPKTLLHFHHQIHHHLSNLDHRHRTGRHCSNSLRHHCHNHIHQSQIDPGDQTYDYELKSRKHCRMIFKWIFQKIKVEIQHKILTGHTKILSLRSFVSTFRTRNCFVLLIFKALATYMVLTVANFTTKAWILTQFIARLA